MKMTGRMKPHAEELACKRGLPIGEKTGYAEMERKPKIRVSLPKILRGKEKKIENPRKPQKNPTRKWREKLKIRVTAKQFRFYGRLEREKKNERGGNAQSPIFMTKRNRCAVPIRDGGTGLFI